MFYLYFHFPCPEPVLHRQSPHRARFPFYQLISNSDWILSKCPWESNFLRIQFKSDVRMSPQSSSQGWSRQCSEASSISLQWFTISIYGTDGQNYHNALHHIILSVQCASLGYNYIHFEADKVFYTPLIAFQISIFWEVRDLIKCSRLMELTLSSYYCY